MISMIQLFPLYLIVFFSYFGYATVIPIFTTMMVHPTQPELMGLSIGLRTTILGALLATYPLGQFLGGSIVGACSDLFGRKRILALSLLIATICFLGVSFSLWKFNLPLLFTFLFIAGFSEANIIVAQNAITDLVPKEESTQKLGFVFAAIALGYTTGPIFGGILSDSKLVSWFSYWTPFVIVSALLFTGFLWTLLRFQETSRSKEVEAGQFFQVFLNIKNIFTDKRLRFYYLINALIYFSVYGYFRGGPIYISHEFKTSIFLLGVFVAYMAVFNLLVNVFLMKPISRRFSPHVSTTAGSFLMGMFMIAVPLFSNINSLWITLFLTSSVLGVALSSCTAMLSHLADQEEQGKVMGNNLSVLGGMTALGAFAGGALAAIDLHIPLLVFGTISVLASFVSFFKKSAV